MAGKFAIFSCALIAAAQIALASGAGAQQYPPVGPVPPIDPAFRQNIPPPMDMQGLVQRQIDLYNQG